jgi:hypothetical protein
VRILLLATVFITACSGSRDFVHISRPVLLEYADAQKIYPLGTCAVRMLTDHSIEITIVSNRGGGRVFNLSQGDWIDKVARVDVIRPDYSVLIVMGAK